MIVTLVWADGEHPFRLKLGQIVELQEKCDAGPHMIYMRVENGMWRVNDLRETIRLGLIGGGMKPDQATKLVRTYVDERPLLESRETALAILGAALVGPEGLSAKKDQAAGENPEPVETAASPSPPSTATDA